MIGLLRPNYDIRPHHSRYVSTEYLGCDAAVQEGGKLGRPGRLSHRPATNATPVVPAELQYHGQGIGSASSNSIRDLIIATIESAGEKHIGSW